MRVMAASDLIGTHGEFIVCARLMDFCGTDRPYFEPHNLGAKCPTFDFLVELVGVPRPLYFLAQVKTTTKGTGKRKTRLPVEVSEKDVERMRVSPIPTYLIGVDEPAEVAYIACICGDTVGSIASIPRTHPLTPRTLKRLWDEVQGYWDQFGTPVVKTSAFTL
jgi:hypothetical protein